MLSHLCMEPHDHYGDGAWYDAEYIHIRADVPYYARVAGATKGAILELACGTGRLTIPMVRAGGTVHGIDCAPSMIASAEEKRAALPSFQRERLSFEVADMRALRIERTFAAVVLAFNTLMHMVSDDDLSSALETVRVHLAPGGLFYFDLHTPFPELLTRDATKRYDPQEMIAPKTRERYIVTESNEYDARTQINRMYFFYQRVDRNGSPEGSEKRAELQLRVIFPRELDRWLYASGLEVVSEWDDFECKNPFSGKGGRRVVVARAR